MSNQNQNDFAKLNQKLEEMDRKISFIQDTILKLKLNLEIIAKNNAEEQFLPKLTIIADDNLNLFLEKRPMSCQQLEQCSTFVEKGTLKIMRTFTEKGPEVAKKLINSYREYINTRSVIKNCPDLDCLKSVSDLLDTLDDVIRSIEIESLEETKKLFTISTESPLIEDSLEESNLLSPLSNESRLNILKVLSRGNLYYNQLEHQVGIKGGPFHFHLKKLTEAGYVIQKQERGAYEITISGLKALKFLSELKKKVSIKP